MKKLFFFFLFFTLNAQAGILKSFSVDASATNITPNYTFTAESLVASAVKYAMHVCAFNGSASLVALNVDDGGAGILPANGTKELLLLAGTGGCVGVDPRSSVYVYLRSFSGVIAAGLVVGDLRDKD